MKTLSSSYLTQLTILTFCLCGILIYSWEADALVSQPIPLAAEDEFLDLRFTREGGVMKPTTEQESWQKAGNRITTLSYRRGVGSDVHPDLNFILEYRFIETPVEKHEGHVAHRASSGHQFVFGGGRSLHHTLDSRVDVYFRLSPWNTIETAKFALPRIDLAQAGVQSGFNLSRELFLESLVHFGSGVPQRQNMYLLFSQALGLRQERALYKFGPYMEADLEARRDSNYSSRAIQLYKVGVLLDYSYRLAADQAIGVSYLQKIHGQYLPATNALSFYLNYKL